MRTFIGVLVSYHKNRLSSRLSNAGGSWRNQKKLSQGGDVPLNYCLLERREVRELAGGRSRISSMISELATEALFMR